MIKFANKAAGKKRITNAFVAACGMEDDHVDTQRLVPALRLFDLVLLPQPEGWAPPDPEKLKAEARAAKAAEEEERKRLLSREDVVAEADAKSAMENAVKSLRQLSIITKVLKALGRNMESVSEEDALRLIEDMG